VFDDCAGRLPAISLVERYGAERAMNDTAACIEDAVRAWLTSR
jgi:hypothetical protein